MGGIFSGFGGGNAEQGGGGDASAATTPPAPATVTDPNEAQATPPAPGSPTLAPTTDGKPAPAAAPEIVPGVPLWLHGVDGDATGIYWLTTLDLDASHEIGQPSRHAGIDGDRQVAGIGDPVRKSGGAAYYFNALAGKGFSVPVAPEGA